MLFAPSLPKLPAYHNSSQWILSLGESLHKAGRGLFLNCKSGHVITWLKVFSASLLSTRESLESSDCHSRHDPIWPQPHFPTSSATSHRAPTLCSGHIIQFIFMLFGVFFFVLSSIMTNYFLFHDSPQVYFL